MVNKDRFIELDIWRGFSVCGMILFHIFFVLNYFGRIEVELFSGSWHILAQFVRISFLLLVGISIVISYKRAIFKGLSKRQAILHQWRRAFFVLLGALLVSVATYIFSPSEYVRFGILHLIAVSIFFWNFFVEWKWFVLFLAFVGFWLGGWFGDVIFDGMSPWFYAEALDYFPIFPWTSVVGVGIFLGHVFYSHDSRFAGVKFLRKFWLSKVLCFFGRNSLLIYLVHVPLIVFLLWITGLIILF